MTNDELLNGLESDKPQKGVPPLPRDVPTLQIGKAQDKSPKSRVAPLSYTIDRQAIINYAHQYWSSYNPAYRNFNNAGTQGGDCTNFVSQALRAGGWPDVFGLDRTSRNVWFYNLLYQSYTWVNTEDWWWFTYGQPRAYLVTSLSDLAPGDIIQIDSGRVGQVEHTMIVTKQGSDGTVYLTYHTNDTLDKSFWAIYSPNDNYYAWHLFLPPQ